MDIFLVILAALLPAAILLFYIYRRDKYCREPWGKLLLGFFFGVLSAPLSLCLSVPLGELGFYGEPTSVGGAVCAAFFGAAIPEELAKLVMLWLLVKLVVKKHFDEYTDGIVYAVSVGLGFAGIENVMYLFQYYDNWVSVGIMRGLLSVPGHFAFAVIMGYYFSLVYFDYRKSWRNRLFTILIPIMAHGIFDTILMSTNSIDSTTALVLVVVFFVFLHYVFKWVRRHIKNHLALDSIRFMAPPLPDETPNQYFDETTDLSDNNFPPQFPVE